MIGVLLIAVTVMASPISEQSKMYDASPASFLAEPTCLLFGWINSSLTHDGIEDAVISASLEDHSFHNYTYTNETGYYEIEVPRDQLSVYCFARGHLAYTSEVDTTGQAIYRLDAELEAEPTAPEVSMTLDQDSSISRQNPLRVNVVVEDFNLVAVSVMLGGVHDMSNEWVNFTPVDAGGVYFHEWEDSVFGDFQYAYEDDTFDGLFTWPATTMRAGYLVTSSNREHVQMWSERSISGEVSYGVAAFYTNDTLDMAEGVAWFNNESGEYEEFQFRNTTTFEDSDIPDALPEDDGVITPFEVIYPWKLDSSGADDIFDWFTPMRRTLDPRSVASTTFEYDDTALSGDYIAILMATDEVTNMAWTEELFTVDSDPPVADAGEEQTIIQGAEAALSGSGSSDNVGIVNFIWSFEDDGQDITLYGEVVSYEFSEAGAHQITLTVRDAGLNEDQDTTVVYVDGQVPTAEAGPGEMTVPEDVPVVFDGGDSEDDVGIADYSWEIVELEEYGVGSAFTFTFDQPGVYHVELIVVDRVGQVSEPDMITVTVTDETVPDADAGEDMQAVVGASVILNGSGSSDNVGIESYRWSGDDGEPWELLGMTVERMFESTGTHVITLDVFDEAGNSGTDTLTIHVVEPPVADAGEDGEVHVGDLVYLNASGSSDDTGIENYTWIFEYDGETTHLYGEMAEFTFDIDGTYDINLTVTDEHGLKGYDNVTVTVTEKSTSTGFVLYAVAAVAALVALLAVGMLLTKRKGPK
ncbi:MAG: PKD domain-containing protein [Thermoplasmata archaeon]|nr:PKD domain-containing protein [Thermoplasmata archaeon]